MGSGSVVAQIVVPAVEGMSGQPHALATLPTTEERQSLSGRFGEQKSPCCRV